VRGYATKTILAAILLAVQVTQVSPFQGEWKTDLPANFKDSSAFMAYSGIRFDVTADSVKMTHRYAVRDSLYLQPSPANGEGRSITTEETVRTDGKPHPSELATRVGHDWTVVGTWLNAYSLDLISTRPGDRSATIHVTYSLSADRKTLTYRSVTFGTYEERIFYR
jgi:hypothetical protein